MSTTYANEWNALAGPGFTFVVSELINPPSEKAEELFAQFKSELEHFSDLGSKNYTELHMISDKLTITYYIPVASFGVISSQIDPVIEYYNSKTDNDYLRDRMDLLFQTDTERVFNYIDEEIEIYSRNYNN